jgi:hypothetical protein|tara:strand:- start:391 stop:645 length:255 start_codon:yes stop_codon:yes gene_type:complete
VDLIDAIGLINNKPAGENMGLEKSEPKRLTIYLNEDVWGKLQRLNHYSGVHSSCMVQSMIQKEFNNKKRYIEIVERHSAQEGEE